MIGYGKEIVLDLHNCDSSLFTKEFIEKYFIELCEKIDMQRELLYFWDFKDYLPEEDWPTEPHLVGISAIQFIRTSNVTIHTLDILKKVFLNIFSCKDFDADVAIQFSANYFKGKVAHSVVTDRI